MQHIKDQEQEYLSTNAAYKSKTTPMTSISIIITTDGDYDKSMMSSTIFQGATTQLPNIEKVDDEPHICHEISAMAIKHSVEWGAW